jgi:hypothetical protein
LPTLLFPTLNSLTYSYDQVAAFDFDKDKNLDLLTCGAAAIFLSKGDGNGGFAAAKSVVTGGAGHVVVSDLNKDGKLDLVLGTGQINIRVALGNGDGTFATPTTFAGTSAGLTHYLAVGDINGDTIQDIATSTVGVNSVNVLTGRGDDTFNIPAPTTIPKPAVGGLIAADFTGDGFIDLAYGTAGNANSANISVLINKGNGTFLAPTNSPVSIPSFISLCTGDLNGDGILDLTVVSPNAAANGLVVALLGKGDGTFVESDKKPLGRQTYGSTLVDVNGDGRLDILVAATTMLGILEGIGEGKFVKPLLIPVTSAAAVIAGPLNGDQRADVVAFGGAAKGVILLNETEFLPAVPELSWKTVGGQVRIVWYANYEGYILEHRSNFDLGSSWSPAPGSPATVDCQYFYAVPPGEATGFYQLAKP